MRKYQWWWVGPSARKEMRQSGRIGLVTIRESLIEKSVIGSEESEMVKMWIRGKSKAKSPMMVGLKGSEESWRGGDMKHEGKSTKESPTMTVRSESWEELRSGVEGPERKSEGQVQWIGDLVYNKVRFETWTFLL